MKDKKKAPKARNYVAKNMSAVNRCSAHRDKKNDYVRKTKYKEW